MKNLTHNIRKDLYHSCTQDTSMEIRGYVYITFLIDLLSNWKDVQ